MKMNEISVNIQIENLTQKLIYILIIRLLAKSNIFDIS